jgi:glyoxylase-like metal-dependent hydrolase (beta-lactamase superfamily II)
MNIQLDNIKYLVLTHHHNDHCGLLDFLVSENQNIKVIMSRKCSEFLKAGKHHRHPDERYSNTILGIIIRLFAKLNRNWSESFIPYTARESDKIIESDNDTLLTELGISGKILLTPGHSEDSLSIVIGETAFVGDSARNMLNFTGTPFQPILIYDLKACEKSWEKVIASGAVTLYPAHGKPFPGRKLYI